MTKPGAPWQNYISHFCRLPGGSSISTGHVAWPSSRSAVVAFVGAAAMHVQGGEQRAGRAPHQLARGVVEVALDQRRDVVGECRRGGQVPGHHGTYKNCVGSLYLPYTGAVEKLTLGEQAAAYRRLIKEQKQVDVVKRAANGQIGLSDRLDQLKTFEEKNQLLSFFNDLCINTFVISYAGQLQLGECDRFVDSMHLYSGGNRGLILNMASAGEYMTIDVLQAFESEQFVSELVHSLEELGLRHTVSPRIEFTTTRDRTFATGRWQAERFYGQFEG